ncbi:MAG: hypothetical protein FJ011_00700, partial [Chloroflexi bacterium]|nr:hypothetical protein [Chloroflexota bacterium]
TALAFGHGDQQVLIGGLDGRLSLWDAVTGKQPLLKPFGREIDHWVTQVALSSDGSLAAAVTNGIGLGVWDTRSGQLLDGTVFDGQTDWAELIHFVPDGPLSPQPDGSGLLVYGQDTKQVYLYDPRSDTIRRRFKGECESPTQMAVSQDGTTLAMDCAEGIMVWQGDNDTPAITSIPQLLREIKALYAEGLNGSFLVLDADGMLWKPRAAHDTLKKSWTRNLDAVHAAAFSLDGAMLAVASSGGVISLVRVASGVTVQTWRHGSAESATAGVTAVAFSDDGLTLATAGEDGRVRLWDVSPGARYCLMSSELPVALPASYCAQPGNSECRTVVAAPQNARLFTWETSASSALALDRIPISRTLRISPDGRYAVVQAADKQLCAWATATAREIGCLPAWQSRDNIRAMAIGGSEPTLATWDGNDLRLWRLPDFDLERSIPVSAEQVSLVALSPAAPILAVVEAGEETKLWDISGGEAKLLRRLPSPLGSISQLAFSPDGGVLWMASGGRTASLISRWQVAAGQESPAQRLRVDTAITALTVSPTGDRLAAGGQDRMIYLWNAATGAEIGRLNASGVTALAFNGDGRVLFSAEGRSSAVRIWPLELQELLAQAAARIARDPPQLTGAERRRYGLK